MSDHNGGLSPAIRGGIALVLIAGIAGLILWLGQGDEQGDSKETSSSKQGGSQGEREEPKRPPVFTTSAQCKKCHERVYKEWRGSHHAMAYTNPEVRKLSDDFAQKECRSCHLPKPILQTGAGERTLYRQSRPEDGVDCISCHLDAQGRIAGKHSSNKGCQPVANADLVSMRLCESCHNQHQTTDQWRASAYPAAGVTCNTCHMEEVPTGGERPGRDHGYPGCHDLNKLKSAAELRVVRKDEKIMVELENTGAGHNFPTEERHRAVDIIWRIADKADGKKSAAELPFTRLYRFRQPYRGDPGPNTQLPSGQTWKGQFDLPAGSKGKLLQIRLTYKLTPFLTDDEADVLAQKEIQL